MPFVAPQVKKNWLYASVANVNAGGDAQNQKDFVIRVKNQRQAWGQTISGSSDGTTGALDAVDRWTDITKIPNFTTTPWLVFQNGNGSQDLLAYNNSGESDWTFVHSPGGLFAGGSAAARPTAVDETVLYADSFFGRGGGGSNPTFRCNMWFADDGSCIRFSYWSGGFSFGNVFFDAVDDPTPGWATPNYALFDKHGVDAFSDQGTAEVFNYCFTPFDGKGVVKTWGPHGAMNLLGTTEASGYGGVYPLIGVAQPSVLSGKNGISGTYRRLPRCGLVNDLTGGTDARDIGWHGQIFDLWWVAQNPTFPKGSTTPLDGSKQFVILGDYMLPWNGTPFLTS